MGIQRLRIILGRRNHGTIRGHRDEPEPTRKGQTGMQRPPSIQSQITFLYYDELAPIARFYEQVMGFEPVEDQEWARIYRVGGAFLGIVAGDKGHHRAQEKSAVLVTLVVDDVAGWHGHLKAHGVQTLTEVQDREDIQIRCFFFDDPGGYSLEIQQFLRPASAAVFHKQS